MQITSLHCSWEIFVAIPTTPYPVLVEYMRGA